MNLILVLLATLNWNRQIYISKIYSSIIEFKDISKHYSDSDFSIDNFNLREFIAEINRQIPIPIDFI